MKITILGCGPSYGIPDALSGYGDCDPNNPKNNRTRTGALIQTDTTTLLIDTPPELRQQLFNARVKEINAILWTHDHSDHTAGIDDIKAFAFWHREEKTIPAYIHQKDQEVFLQRTPYLFKPMSYLGVSKPPLEMKNITPFQETAIGDIRLYPILQKHGTQESIGFRIGGFAYNSDLDAVLGKGLDELKGIKTWVLGCVTPNINQKHLYLEKALKWIEYIKPERVFFTHMGSHMDYDTLCRELPPHIRPAYDGLIIEI